MKNYWQQHYDSNTQQFESLMLKQVGKTINGQEISDQQVTLIVENIVNNLLLISSDSVIDLCCGNGLITRLLAPFVKNVVGVDFSTGLIDVAKRYNSNQNIEYINSDVLSLDLKHLSGTKKVLMYEALQLFSEEQLSSLLAKLSNLEVGSLIFFASIPNKEKLHAYYDTEEKFLFYQRSELEGKPHMGRWWLVEEIERIASGHNFKTISLPQVPMLYTAYYRFDVLMEKCP